MNFYLEETEGYKNVGSKYQWWEWLIVIAGVIVWVLVLAGSFFPDTNY